MKIFGTFKDRDNNTVTVQIYNIDKSGNDINIDTCDWIRFSSDPVVITTDCEDSFTHIIKKSCKITLKTKQWLGDYLFANKSTSIIVNVIRNNDYLFVGYVTPNTYNMNFAHVWEDVEINCVDKLSTLENTYANNTKSWEDLKALSEVRPFSYFIQQMNLADRTLVIDNLPNTTNQTQWVEVGYVKIDSSYYATENNVKIIDVSSAVTTNENRIGDQLLTTLIQSSDIALYDGVPYYKKYVYVSVNGQLIRTEDWEYGDPVTDLPTIIDSSAILISWCYDTLDRVPFEYYEFFQENAEMDDGTTYDGYNYVIGNQIPQNPSTTSLNSYWEYRQGDSSDLIIVDSSGAISKYYKNYGWVIQTINGETVETKTNDFVQGTQYILNSSII